MRYYRIIDGQPFSVSLRQSLPNTSNPDLLSEPDLESYGIYQLLPESGKILESIDWDGEKLVPAWVDPPAPDLPPVPIQPNWVGFRNALYPSPEWYSLSTSSLPALKIANELSLLLWSYSPEAEAEVVATIAAFKAVTNPTEEQKITIANVMQGNSLPQSFIDEVLK